MEEHAAAVRATRISGDASAAAAGDARRGQVEAPAAAGTAAGGGEERRREPAEGRRAAGEAEGRRREAVSRDHRLPVHEGDLRSGSLRLRGVTGQRVVERREEGSGCRRGTAKTGRAGPGA